jgi:hypothetical protein
MIKDHYELEKGRGKVDTIREMWYKYVHVLPKLTPCELEFILALQYGSYHEMCHCLLA